MSIQSQEIGHSGVELAYFRQLSQGTFQIQHCRNCGRYVFYPREICPHCSGQELEWVTPSGRGTVYSHTTVRRRPDTGGDYNVALIDLEEGVRMMACVTGTPPAEVKIGMAVTAKVVERNGAHVVVFEEARQ